MASTTSVGAGSLQLLVPRRPDGGWRDELWEFCRPRWGYPVVEGSSPDGPFNRAAAINDAARCGAWDVGVVVDADVVADPAQVAAAAAHARATGRATLGFTEHRALSRRTTLGVLAGAPPPWPGWKRENHESSLVAVPRRLWEELGGYDERFCGWGQEDVAFAQAARVLGGGLERVPGVVYHLFHPLSAEKNRGLPRYQANQALGAAYRGTSTPEGMRALLAGDRQAVFAGIYASNAWRGRETRSGPGSSRRSTERIQRFLQEFCAEVGALSVLDAACGASSWMPELPGYRGVDIVPWAVDQMRQRFPERRYEVADICRDELGPVDVVVMRDVLAHLSTKEVQMALQNARARYLVATTFEGADNSLDTKTGGYRELDLRYDPFGLGDPARSVADGYWERTLVFPNKRLAAWALGS